MIHGVHIEVILAGGYALLLVGVAVILEFVARHAHRRSEHFRNSGFTYKKNMDVWECPTGHHLTREQTDFERKIAHYRAPAHKCNACHLKKDCTDSDDGRLLESRLDAWLQSELPLSSRHFVCSAAAGRAHSCGGDVRASVSARLDCARRIVAAHRLGLFALLGFLFRTKTEKLEDPELDPPNNLN